MRLIRIFVLCMTTAALAHAAPIVPKNNESATYIPQTIATADGFALTGHLAVPTKGQAPYPAVLMLMGSGPGDRYEDVPGSMTADGKDALVFKGLEDQLVKKGIAVFTYDKRGVSPKDDTFFDPSIDPEIYDKTGDAKNLASDALLAFDQLKGLAQIDSKKMAVLGHSEGTALAMKVAEKRPEIRSLLMLGIWTRSFEQIGYYQGVVNNMRIFYLMDADQDGLLTKGEFQPFATEFQTSWEKGILPLDLTGDGRVSEQEFRYFYEQQHKQSELMIRDNSIEWNRRTPRAWYQQYEAEGEFLSRHLAFCGKMNIFQGEIDVQTPFEDALELKEHCASQGTPLVSFHSYAGEGHAFSPRIGLRGWNDSVGPMDSNVQQEIAEAAAAALK